MVLTLFSRKIPAFILNLEQHWFTLRRFGDASPLIEVDEGNGLWFNLNSFLPSPEWLSKTYLGMVIQQAEAEGKHTAAKIMFCARFIRRLLGYSVFAVTQEDPYKPLALFRTQVDMLFSFIAEPTSSSTQGLDNSLATLKGSVQKNAIPTEHEALDEDDYELQRALQASLMETDSSIDPGELSPITVTESPTPPLASVSDSGTNPELDPVAASMERNRLLLQRMRQEQELAQRELWESEAELSMEEQAALEQRRARARRQEEEEEMELRRAIEESEALARLQVQAPRQSAGSITTSQRLDRPSGEEQLPSTGRPCREDPQTRATPPTPGLTDPDTDTDDDTQESTAIHDEPDAPTLEEIRQARLARFGN